MRDELLAIIEKNGRIDLKELAVLLGVQETDVVSELAALESEGVICGYHAMINWGTSWRSSFSPALEV